MSETEEGPIETLLEETPVCDSSVPWDHGTRRSVREREILGFDVKKRARHLIILLSISHQLRGSWDSAPSSSFMFQYCDMAFLKDQRA